MSVELVDVIFTALGALVAGVVFFFGRTSAASSLGRRQGEVETKIARLEEDVRNLQEMDRRNSDRYVTHKSFNDVIHRVDDGIRELQSRLDSIYSLLVTGRNE